MPPAAPRWVATNALEASPPADERAAGVEAEPTEPEDPRAEEHHRHVVRTQRARSEPAPPAQIQGRRERSRARVDVHDGAAREVERAHAGGAEEPAAPHPVRDRRVHEHRPEPEEQQVAAEPHPLGERPGDERRRDHREHHLEDHERRGRNARRERHRSIADPPETHVFEPADQQAVIGPEGERVPDEHPQHRDHAERDQRLHHRPEHVLGTHEPAVEQGETRRHEHHERRGHEHPRGVTGVDPHRLSFSIPSREPLRGL